MFLFTHLCDCDTIKKIKCKIWLERLSVICDTSFTRETRGAVIFVSCHEWRFTWVKWITLAQCHQRWLTPLWFWNSKLPGLSTPVWMALSTVNPDGVIFPRRELYKSKVKTWAIWLLCCSKFGRSDSASYLAVFMVGIFATSGYATVSLLDRKDWSKRLSLKLQWEWLGTRLLGAKLRRSLLE